MSINTRLAVVSGLAESSSRGNNCTVQLMVQLASESNDRIAIAAMEALGLIAEKGDRDAIRAIKGNLPSSNKEVRGCAEDALAIVALGDAQTIDMFCGEARFCKCNQEREQAIAALGNIAMRGDTRVVKILSAFLQGDKLKKIPGAGWWDGRDADGFAQCRSHAIVALAKVAPHDDKGVMKLIFEAFNRSLREGDKKTACISLRSFAELTRKDNNWAIDKMALVLDDKVLDPVLPFRQHVKVLVLELLAVIGSGGEPYIFRKAMATRRDADPVVRAEAIRTAGKTWHIKQDMRTHHLDKIAKEHGNPMVRREAEAALAQIAAAKERYLAERETRPGCVGCAQM
jgi:hypothetical protein